MRQELSLLDHIYQLNTDEIMYHVGLPCRAVNQVTKVLGSVYGEDNGLKPSLGSNPHPNPLASELWTHSLSEEKNENQKSCGLQLFAHHFRSHNSFGGGGELPSQI